MPELRESGIDVLGKIPWGSHFCTFYDTKEDQFDILVSYFKAGLENNEYCLWVVSVPGVVTTEEVKLALAQAIPAFNSYLAEKKIEILDSTAWYLEENIFNAEKAINAWLAKLKNALAQGYDGMRVSGDTGWLNKQFWKDFHAYEKKLNYTTSNIPMIVLCAYPLSEMGAADIFDVAQVHQFAIAKRKGEWEFIEAATQIEARAEIKRLNEQLQQSRIKIPTPRPVLKYGMAVLSVVAALSLAVFLDIYLVTAPVSLFLCAIMLSAWYGGIKPGLLATLLSLLAFKFYFIAPVHSFIIPVNEVPRIFIFALSALFVLLLSTTQRSKTESVRRARNILEGIVRKLQNTNSALLGEISERKQAEALLHAKEQQFRAIVENTPDHIIRFTSDYCLAYVNPAVLKAYDVPIQALVGKPFDAVVHQLRLEVEEGALEQLRKQIATVFNTAKPCELEINWPLPEGRRYFSVGFFPELDSNASVINVLTIARDITARKHMEDALRESELRLRQITENIHEVFWMATPGLEESLYVSPSYESIWGRSVESLQQQPQSFFDGIYPEDRGYVINLIKEKREKEFDIEYRILKPDGTIRWIRDRGFPVKDESGRVYRVTGVSEDITMRKEAEDAIRQNEDRIRLIIDTIPTMAWSVQPDGIVDFVNQRWLDYSGLTLEEEIKNPAVIVHPEDLSRAEKKWHKDMVTAEPTEDEMRLRRADGAYRWFLIRTAPLRNKEGNVVKWYGVAIDIEDSKRAEDELRLAYQRLSYHFENTPLAVIELDKDLFIKRWSKRAEEIFGWQASEVLGKNVNDADFPIIYKEDIQAVDTINEQLTKGIVDRNFSLNRNYTKDGSVIYSEWYNSVLRDEKGNAITILSLVHNVTERKNAEETLNQSYEEIRRLTAHLQNIREEERIVIAREIHDELGQQLTVLKMEVKGLNKKLNTADEGIKYKIAEIIDLLDSMVQSVRRISSELRPSLLYNLGLAAAIEWHLKEFEKRSGTKTTFNELSEDLDMPDSIKNGLFRIFQESLTNISKHANATEINVTLQQKGQQLILSIADDGQGFEEKEIGSKRTLGILGMKERAQVMDGNYEISSIPGKGTTVIVIVPYNENNNLNNYL